MDARLCPVNIQESVKAYVEGRPTGGFLRAVLENNLLEAVCRADIDNSVLLYAIVAFVNDEVADAMWGSPEAVAKHLHACAGARKDATRRNGGL